MWGGCEIRLLGMGERAGQGGVAGRVGRPWVERFRAGGLFVCVCVGVGGRVGCGGWVRVDVVWLFGWPAGWVTGCF